MRFSSSFDFALILISILIVVLILITITKKISQGRKSRASTVINVTAQVVAKRTSVSVSHGAGETGLAHTNTAHYATFQAENGGRVEFYVLGSEYDVLAEGDAGKLAFKGTAYLDFVRRG